MSKRKPTKTKAQNLRVQKRLAYLPGQISFGLLGVLGLALVCPFVLDDSAATGETLPASASTTNAAVAVQSTLSVSLSPEVDMTVTPSPSGSFTSGAANLRISTNNSTGYSVYVNTDADSTAMTSAGLTGEIKALSAPAQADGFANNSWGYSLARGGAGDGSTTDSALYRGITKNLYKAESTAANTALDEYSLHFGAKVDNILAAGQYSNEVLVSVVANPTALTKLSELIYMQDISPEICANTGEITVGNEVEKQLIDVRDGKKYWVAKLADQNCWMTQNLALDLEAGQTLTPGTSDVSREWVVPESTSHETPAPIEISADSPENWGVKSWDFGDFALVTPQRFTVCTPNPTNAQKLSNCPELQDVNSGWQPTFSAKEHGENGTWGDYTGYVTANQNAQTYDAHYLIGNYYQFNAATAGTGGRDLVSKAPSESDNDAELVAKFEDAPDSICPANWKLPVGGRRDFTLANGKPGSSPLDRQDSFYNLFLAYGYEPKLYNPTDGNGDFYTGNSSSANRNTDKAPFYFTRNGVIRYNLEYTSGGISFIGTVGSFTSSTAGTSSTRLYEMFVSQNGNNIGHFGPAAYGFRYIGKSIRCLAK